MRRIISLLLLIATIVVMPTTLTSCGDDEPDTPDTPLIPDNPVNPGEDDSQKYDIVGLWETYYEWTYSTEHITLDIKSNGTLSYSSISDNGNDPGYGSGSWTYNSSNAKWELLTGYSMISGNYVIVNNQLICQTIFNDGSTRTVVYERVGNSGSQSEISSNDFIGKWNHPSGAYVIDLQSAGTCYLYILKSWKGDTYTEKCIGTWEYNLSTHKLKLTTFKGKIEETVSASNFPNDFTTNEGKWTKCNTLPNEESNNDASKLYGTWVGKDYDETYTISFYSDGKAKEVWTDGYDSETLNGTYEFSNCKITSWNMSKGSILANVLGDCPWLVTYNSANSITLGSGYNKMTLTKK